MQKLLFILILLINFLSIKSQVCKESTKKASLIFYHYCPERPNGMTRISITTSIVSKYQADLVYVLTGNQTNENTMNVLRVRCERINYNLNDCSQYFKSSYILLEHMIDDSCIMRFEEKHSEINNLLHSLSLRRHDSKLNLTCMIERIYDGSKESNRLPFIETNLFNILFLSSCIVVTCSLCIAWFAAIYYRRFVRNRLKRQQQKELERSVQKTLEKLPIIIFNSQNRDYNFIDDESVCTICLESFIDNEKIRKLLCSHYFHLTCIDPWLLAHQNCPLCNQNILNDPIPSISARITSTNNQESESTHTPILVNDNPIIESQNL